MEKISELAQQLRPYWLADDAKLTGITSLLSGGGGGALLAHALSGVYHTGELAEAQASWAATKAELAAHALLANVHHAAATAGDGISVVGQAISLAAGVPGAGLSYSEAGVLAVGQGNGLTVGADAVALTTPGTLTVATANDASGNHKHAITSSSNPGAAASLLATDANGHTAVVKLRTPTIDTASGALSLAPNSGLVSLTSAVAIGTDNYASQLTGWRATYAGEADFRYLFVDEMHAKSFIADLEQALAGGQIITKSVAMLAQAFTAPAAGVTAALYVRDLPSAPNMAAFQTGDIVLLRTFSRSAGSLTIANCWGVVTGYVDGDGNNFAEGVQGWTFTRSAAPNAGTMSAGATVAADAIVLDFGTTGMGYYEVNAIDGAYGQNSPYARIVKWDTHPATGQYVVGQFGNLRGAYGYTGSEYGLAVGQYASGKANITIDPTNGVRLRSHSTDILQIKNSDGLGYIVGPLYLDTAGGIYQGSGTFGTPTTGIKLSNVGGYGKLAAYYGGVAQNVFDAQGMALQYKNEYGGGAGAEANITWYVTPISRTTQIARLTVGQSPNYVYAPEVPPEERVPALIYKSAILTSWPDIVLQKANSDSATVWHTGNMGSGSDLDADTLDTHEAAEFALLTGATFTGAITVSKATDAALLLYSSSSNVAARNWGITANHTAYGDLAIMRSTAKDGNPLTAGTEWIYVDPLGRVGVGVAASLGYALHAGRNLELGGSTTAVVQGYDRAATAYKTLELSGADILFEVGGAEKGRFDSSGNLLVGTTGNTYSAKLNVNGDIYGIGAVTGESFLQMKWRTSTPDAAMGFGRLWVKDLQNNNKMELRFRTYLGDFLISADTA